MSQKSALICISTFLGQAFVRIAFHTLLPARGRSGIGVLERYWSIDSFLQLCFSAFSCLAWAVELLQAEAQAQA